MVQTAAKCVYIHSVSLKLIQSNGKVLKYILLVDDVQFVFKPFVSVNCLYDHVGGCSLFFQQVEAK